MIFLIMTLASGDSGPLMKHTEMAAPVIKLMIVSIFRSPFPQNKMPCKHG